MKRLLLIPISIFISMAAMAQAPQGIPYQAAAKTSTGATLVNTTISVRFTIHDSEASGTTLYQETFSPTTNAQGVFSVNVGMGTPVTGTFNAINWGTNAKFMQVEMDPTGGSSYVDMGTQQMMSVPYALYSGTAQNIVTIPQLHVQVFTSSGTFTTSSHVTSATVFKFTIIGGGGGGSAGANMYYGGGGGGGGGTSIYITSGLNKSTNYNVIVGNGGLAANTYGIGENGDTSSISLGGVSIFSTGGTGSNQSMGGGGGFSFNGTININGGAGASSTGCDFCRSYGGLGGSSSFGSNNAYGSGGPGGDNIALYEYTVGGNGKSGVVIIEWME